MTTFLFALTQFFGRWVYITQIEPQSFYLFSADFIYRLNWSLKTLQLKSRRRNTHISTTLSVSLRHNFVKTREWNQRLRELVSNVKRNSSEGFWGYFYWSRIHFLKRKVFFFLTWKTHKRMRISQKHFSGRLAPFKFKLFEYFLK